jgi:hypothetical protein
MQIYKTICRGKIIAIIRAVEKERIIPPVVLLRPAPQDGTPLHSAMRDSAPLRLPLLRKAKQIVGATLRCAPEKRDSALLRPARKRATLRSARWDFVPLSPEKRDSALLRPEKRDSAPLRNRRRRFSCPKTIHRKSRLEGNYRNRTKVRAEITGLKLYHFARSRKMIINALSA